MKLIAKNIKKKGCERFGTIDDLVEGGRISVKADYNKAISLARTKIRFG
jgi:hypothetical protein